MPEENDIIFEEVQKPAANLASNTHYFLLCFYYIHNDKAGCIPSSF